MRDAQQEIKSTVTVNTSDIAAKAHEDKDTVKEMDRMSRRKGLPRYPTLSASLNEKYILNEILIAQVNSTVW